MSSSVGAEKLPERSLQRWRSLGSRNLPQAVCSMSRRSFS